MPTTSSAFENTLARDDEGNVLTLIRPWAILLSAALPVTLSSKQRKQGDAQMNTITVKDGSTIFYKDWGKGQPIVFSHGWPLSADDWDPQMLFFLKHGYRVIAHDRRGHGRSTQVRTVTTWITMPMTWRR